MNALKLVYDDLPEVLEMPKEVQHHSVKITITPLEDNKKPKNGSNVKPSQWLSNFAGKWKGAPLVREEQGWACKGRNTNRAKRPNDRSHCIGTAGYTCYTQCARILTG